MGIRKRLSLGHPGLDELSIELHQAFCSSQLRHTSDPALLHSTMCILSHCPISMGNDSHSFLLKVSSSFQGFRKQKRKRIYRQGWREKEKEDPAVSPACACSRKGALTGSRAANPRGLIILSEGVYCSPGPIDSSIAEFWTSSSHPKNSMRNLVKRVLRRWPSWEKSQTPGWCDVTRRHDLSAHSLVLGYSCVHSSLCFSCAHRCCAKEPTQPEVNWQISASMNNNKQPHSITRHGSAYLRDGWCLWHKTSG